MSGTGPRLRENSYIGEMYKYNSSAWHLIVCPQNYQFSLPAISPRCFYACGGRWGFHMPETPSRTWVVAMQRPPRSDMRLGSGSAALVRGAVGRRAECLIALTFGYSAPS